MKTIQDHKKESTLNKQIRYPEGIMTRNQWLKLKLAQGATVKEETKKRIDFNRIKFNRMTSYAKQAEYEKKCAEKVPCYNLYEKGQRGYFEITKTEFDRFNELQLADDLNTEKHDLQNRIDAGIATDEEIEEDTQKEFDFFAKYYSPQTK